MLPNEWERSEWRVPNTPRWEGNLVDRNTGVHRNSHSASQEQPQSRKTGERSIRRNIPVIRTHPVYTNHLSPRRPMFRSQQDISRSLITLTFDSATVISRRTARLCPERLTTSQSRTSRQNAVPPKIVRHTAFLKDNKARRAGAEGIWSPPAQQGNYQWKLPPRRAGDGGAQRSRSGP